MRVIWLLVHEVLDGLVEGIKFPHFLDLPHPLLAVPAHKRALVAFLTQGHTGVLQTLLDVVSIRRTGFSANRAGKFLDPSEMLTLTIIELV